jgi:dTDP-4-dehydrorhamnose 3,5-epimerase
MIFTPTELKGAFLIQPELREDERGWFARFFCEDEFAKHDILFKVRQVNRSFTKQKGMLRGLHFQKEPAWEPKVVMCLRGTIYNVVVDLREASPTFRKWQAVELSGENRLMMCTPKGFANGFQALTDDCELLYFMGAPYSPAHAAGVRYDDPALGITWPLSDPILSEKDEALPFLS